VIDDDGDHRTIIKKILHFSGFDMEEAKNSREGIEKANEKKFDYVILDLFMPERDGFETMKQLKKLEQLGDTPVFAMSSVPDKDVKEKVKTAGFNDYFVKPITPFSLDVAIRKVEKEKGKSTK